MTERISKINVIGDPLRYELSYGENYQYEFPGGAYATVHILDNALKSLNLGVQVFQECLKAFSGEQGDFKNCSYFEDLFKSELSDSWKQIANERIPVGNLAWSILNQSAEYNLLKIAEGIVREGINALNNKSLKKTENIYWVPLVEFNYKDEKGKNKSLAVVDRREIEGYSIAHRLISQTKRLKEAKRPLLIGLCLRGHINILVPNRVDEYDDAYVVRRALVLHFLGSTEPVMLN